MSENGFSRYLFEYPYEGSTWAVEVIARDPDDALARIKAMPWARLKGEIAFSASVPDLASLWRKLFHSRN